MDLIVGYLSADATIKGICLEDYQNKEEYFFTAFMKLAFSAFNGKEYLPKLCVHRFTDEFYDLWFN